MSDLAKGVAIVGIVSALSGGDPTMSENEAQQQAHDQQQEQSTSQAESLNAERQNPPQEQDPKSGN